MSKYSREHYIKNRDRILKYKKRHYRKNRKRILNYHKKYAVKHLLKITASSKARHKYKNIGFCEECSAPTKIKHHDDYTKPLEFRYLCQTHHMRLHANKGLVLASSEGSKG